MIRTGIFGTLIVGRGLEIAYALGPPAEGDTGDGGFGHLFGRQWRLILGYRRFRLYRNDAGTWTEVPPVDHLLFQGTLPEDVRGVALSFDQAARPVVAYGLDGHIIVTRWDSTAGQYLQNVDFLGADPCLLMSAEFLYQVPNSDIMLFYLTSDRLSLKYRLQSELYGVEHDVLGGDGSPIVFVEPVTLFRAEALFYQYKLVASSGEIVSDFYPIPVQDQLVGAIGPIGVQHELQILPTDAAGDSFVGGLVPISLIYISDTTPRQVDDIVSAGLLPITSAYTRTILAVSGEWIADTFTGGIAPVKAEHRKNIIPISNESTISGGISPIKGEYRRVS